MRKFIATAFLFLSVAMTVRAQTWELGSTEVHPAPGARKFVSATASSNGHLVVWLDERGGGSVFAARVSPSGEILDPTGIYVGDADYFFHAPRVASDGESYVIAWMGRDANLHTARVSRDGTVAANGWLFRYAWASALATNGRTYLLVVSPLVGPPQAVLLDRNGAAISGALKLPDTRDHSVASHGGSFLLAARSWNDRSDSQGIVSAELEEADFPPSGEERVPALERMFGRDVGKVVVAASARGYAILRREDANFILGWYGRETGEHESPRGTRVVRGSREVSFEENEWAEEVTLTLDGADAYVGYRPVPCYSCSATRSVLRHISGGRVRVVDIGVLDGLTASASPLGSIALALDPATHQIYAAPLTSAAAAPARLVSGSLATQSSSRLVSAAGVHLVVWRDIGRELRVAYTVLSDEGAPLTSQLTVGEDSSSFTVSTDGRTFFILWMTRNQEKMRGCIVAPDGTIVRGPFDVVSLNREFPDDLMWDGSYYNLGYSDGRVLRLSSDGVAIGKPFRIDEVNRDAITLHPVEGGLLGLTWDVWGNGCLCGVNITLTTRVLDRELRPDHRQDPWRGLRLEWHTWGGATAMATGGGHRLFVWQTSAAVYAVGDDAVVHELPYQAAPQDALWTGAGFLVAAENIVARHAPDGTFLDLTPLPEMTLHSTSATLVTLDRGGTPLVLMNRLVKGTPRLAVMRLPALRTAAAALHKEPRS